MTYSLKTYMTAFFMAAIMLFGMAGVSAVNAQDEAADVEPLEVPDPFPSIENEEEMGNFIRDYLMNNPQVIVEAVEMYSRQEQAAAAERSSDAVRANSDWLYNNEAHPAAGPADAGVTVVEFFDYNCGYCKRALSDVMTVLGEDDDVRVVFIELPILGDSSTEAAKWALAAEKQDMYLEYHVALMEHQGRLNDAQLANIAEKVGLDVAKLRQDKDADSILEQLQENINKARELGITGTPAFIIGDELARGYVGLDGLRAGIKQNRGDAE